MGDVADTDYELAPRARQRLGALRFVGSLSEADAAANDCRLVTTAHGADGGRDHIELSLLVDAGGLVQDVRYRTLAMGRDLVLTDLMAEACFGRNLAALPKLTRGEAAVLLGEAGLLLPGEDRNAVFPVLLKIAGRAEAAPAAPPQAGATAKELPWADIGLFEKVRRIEEVLDGQVRPMLASDGGGIELVDLRGEELVVQYHGACGSCSSSIGGTLIFVEDTLNNALGTRLKIQVQGAAPEPIIDL
jgi:NifU-like protein